MDKKYRVKGMKDWHSSLHEAIEAKEKQDNLHSVIGNNKRRLF